MCLINGPNPSGWFRAWYATRFMAGLMINEGRNTEWELQGVENQERWGLYREGQ